jgi:hypothetical protein
MGEAGLIGVTAALGCVGTTGGLPLLNQVTGMVWRIHTVPTQRQEDETMVVLVIGLAAALGLVALGLGVFVLGQPARTPVMLVESDVRRDGRGILP